jgi:hypothetical protein
MTASEATCLVAVLGFCSCDEAFKGRGLAQQDCHWCNCAPEVLDLVRRASRAEAISEKAEARVEELEALCREIRAALEKGGEWDEGCFYYQRWACPELQGPLRRLDEMLGEAVGGGSEDETQS